MSNRRNARPMDVTEIGGVRVGSKSDPNGRENVIFRITKSAYSRQ